MKTYSQKKSKKKRKTTKHPKRQKPVTETSSWVDNIDFVPVERSENGGDEEDAIKRDNNIDEERHTSNISIVSWNILAESYCTRRSHRGLPASYQRKVFEPKFRRTNILHALSVFVDLQVDVICLQEVDLEIVHERLESEGYRGTETPRTARTDGVGIYVRNATWELMDHEVISLDDLATLSTEVPISTSTTSSPTDALQGGESTEQEDANRVSISTSNLQGIQQMFLRRNVAKLSRVREKETGRTVVVVNTHLYWHPGFEHVKLCQAHYILLRAKQFQNENEPFILCGDLNSRPHGITHTYLSRGRINAKRYAPWYIAARIAGEHQMEKDENEKRTGSVQDGNALVQDIVNLHILDEDTEESDDSLRVRYLLDATLNKFCRWLRILGQDAALETDKEEKQRTAEGNMVIFDRCRKEGRTLVTTSTRLMLRRDCPSAAYCINPTYLPNLEVAMVHMFLTHGVVLEPSTFLSRCVVCNGSILEVSHSTEKKRILKEYQAPPDLGDELQVYECNGCQQGYWWNDRPTSSASRVKSAATRLFELCLRGGVPMRGDLDMFDHINVEEERMKGWDNTLPGSELLGRRLDVLEWLSDTRLECPFNLESAYAEKNSQGEVTGERLPFSNVTLDFVSTLDYIFFEKQQFTVSDLLYVPQSFPELNPDAIPNGHILPSDVWPSDHLAVGACLTLSDRIDNTVLAPNASTTSNILDSMGKTFAPINRTPLPADVDAGSSFCLPLNGSPSALPELTRLAVKPSSDAALGRNVPPTPSQEHGMRCDCGCVPAIPSLFEMAELRKQARRRKENEAAQR